MCELYHTLATDGFEGLRTVLEGEFGFLKVFCTKWGEAGLTRGLGEDFVVSSTVLKRYPCHAPRMPQSALYATCKPSTALAARRSRRSPSLAQNAWSSATTFWSPPI